MQIYEYRKVISTQDLAKKYLEEKNNKTAAFIAQEQTAGYGKRGRSFYSPAKTGIYLSIALPNFKIDLNYAGLLTLAIGISVVPVLKKQFPANDFQLKWVNDIYLNDRKIAGILTEKTKFGLIVGIGINITTTSFPSSISDHVGNITQSDVDNNQISRKLVKAIIQATKTYQNAKFLDNYRELSYLKNKKVTLKVGRKHITGRVVTIDNQGRLVIACQNTLRRYSSGEVIKVELNK
jgi:BirA family biotin operon repressor/biotin-[acetyl-CoA-carboxylase] ligase